VWQRGARKASMEDLLAHHVNLFGKGAMLNYAGDGITQDAAVWWWPL